MSEDVGVATPAVTFDDALEAIADLAEFIVTELDRHPCEPSGYVGSVEAQAAVRMAVARRDVEVVASGGQTLAEFIEEKNED